MSYRSKAQESFISRINVFLFKKIIDSNFDIEGNKLSENQEEEFLGFNLHNNNGWVEYFVTEYYQKNYGQVLFDIFSINNQNKLKVQDVYIKLEGLKKLLNVTSVDSLKTDHILFEKYLSQVYPNIYSKNDFNEDVGKCNNENCKCEYCETFLKDIRSLININKIRNKRSDTRGYCLELDRKDPNYEYFKDNVVLSCYWCNNAKTDEFTYKEFKEIAKSIKQVWIDRAIRNCLLTGD